MQLLKTLRTEAGSLEASHFGRFHRGLYLLGRFPEPPRHGSGGFATAVVNMGQVSQEPDPDPCLFLRMVKKSGDNLWQGRISVGRARNNDVVVRHPTISKLHAHFYPTDPDKPWLGLRLVDAGSQNGTRLNGRPIPAGQELEVKSGDRIIFGGIASQLLDAQTLHGALLTLPTV